MGCDRAGPKMTELDGLNCNYFLELCRNVTEIFILFFFREPGYIDDDGILRSRITLKRIEAGKEKDLSKIKRVEDDIFGTELLCYVLEVLIGAAGIFDKNLCQNAKGISIHCIMYAFIYFCQKYYFFIYLLLV